MSLIKIPEMGKGVHTVVDIIFVSFRWGTGERLERVWGDES